MKKIFISIACAILLLTSGETARAGGIPVIDGSVLAQAIAQVTKLTDLVSKTTSIDINSTLTQINTYKTMYDQTIRRPLQDAMNLLTIKNSANQIINLVNGSTGGNSLLVANPEKFVKNAGLNSVQASYNLVAANGGVYSDSILNAIVDATKDDDVETKLASLTQSEIPTTIQNYICDDNLLTKMATYNASQNGNVSYTQGDVETEKQNIYGQVCTGDPNSDPALAQTLLAIGRSDAPLSDQAQDEVWLRLTGGENDFTRTVSAGPVVEKDKADKEYYADKELDWSGGIASEKTCTKKDSTGLCIETAITNPGSVLRDAYSKAKTVGLDTAVNALGTGADGGGLFGDLSGILGLIGDAYNAVSTVSNTINSASGFINSIGGTLGGGDNDAQINAARTPNLSVVATASFTADLVGDSNVAKKNQLISPILAALNAHIAALDSAVTVDTNYIAQANAYRSLIDGVSSCYQNIVVYAAQNNNTYTVPTSVTTFYTSETQTANNLIGELTTEKNTVIPSAKNYINNLIGRITNSNSTEEINYYNSDYLNKVDSGQLPSPTLNTARAAALSTYQTTVVAAQETTGSVGTKMADCASARANLGY